MTISAIVLGATLLVQPKPFDFTPYEPYESNVPRPERILGYAPGSKHTTFRDQERVIMAVTQAAPKRTKVFEFGKSWEGRPLRLIAISSENNINRLEALRQRMEKVASGSADAAKETADLPAFVWINQTIHGNESASFESGMFLLYNFAASNHRDIKSMLDKTVVLLNPVYNPDGHERFTVWNQAIGIGSDHPSALERSEPNWVRGRTNHYRFDMNRDRVALSQTETRAEVKEFLRWNPQVYIDQHGQTSEYFFPPNPMSVHEGVQRDRFNKWTEIFGGGYAKDFDAKGWLYFVRDSFDLYYAGYLDSFVSLTGAIGMTHETDGGFSIRDVKDDGSPLTLELGMAKHMTTAISTVRTSAEHRKALLDSYYTFRKNAATGASAGKFQRVVVNSIDAREIARFAEHLDRAGIKYAIAKTAFEQSDANDFWSDAKGKQSFPAGSLIVDMAQPNGALAKALLEQTSDFEKEFVEKQLRIAERLDKKDRYPNPEFPEFYDATGWSLIYCYNVKAWWCESAPKIEPIAVPVAKSSSVPNLKDSDIGFALDYTDQNDILAVFDLAAQGVRARVVTKTMKLGGGDIKRSQFIFLKGRNEDDLREKLIEASKKRAGLRFSVIPSGYPLSGWESPGGGGNQIVRAPKIGVVMGTRDSLFDVGALWYIMENEFKLEFVPLSSSALNGDLSEFSCIVFPEGGGNLSDKVRSWVQGGGCAVILGGFSWANGDGKLINLAAVEDEKTPIKSVPAAFFKAELDHRSFLSMGYDSTGTGKSPFAIQVDGNRFFKPGTGGLAAVAFGDADSKLLSGWAWPNDTEKNLKNTVAVWEQPVGAGHVVAFAWNPAERAMFPGQWKMLLNAMLLGPGQ